MASPTYCRVLTAPSAGAIAVIRVAGPGACAAVHTLFRSSGGGSVPDRPDDRLRYGRLVDGSESIDDALVSFVPGAEPPAIDICAHGGIRVVERILSVLDRAGAPCDAASADAVPCWPVGSAIDREVLEALGVAKSERTVRFLIRQRALLPETLRRIAARVDAFPDAARREVAELVKRYATGRVLTCGATVALVGPPNSGKSTLFNRLIGRSAALVSAEAGTTRDWVAQEIELGGVPITLVDTAGRRSASDEIEREAIHTGRARAEGAERSILVLDGSRPLSDIEAESLVDRDATPPALVAINKSDLRPAWTPEQLAGHLVGGAVAAIRVSARTGEGLEALAGAVLASLEVDEAADRQPCLFTGRQARVARRVLSDLSGSATSVRATIERNLIEGLPDDIGHPQGIESQTGRRSGDGAG